MGPQDSLAQVSRKFGDQEEAEEDYPEDRILRDTQDSQRSDISDDELKWRRNAWRTVINNNLAEDWKPIQLLSTTDHHGTLDDELGGLDNPG